MSTAHSSKTDLPNPDEHVEEDARGEGPAGDTAALLSAVVPLLLGIGFVILGLRLPLGTVSTPGPGLWPVICGAAVVLSSTALLFIARRIEHPERITRNIWTVGVGLASLAGFVVLMPLIGFEIPLLLLFVVWLKVLGSESWRTSVVIAVVATVVVYLLFIQLLGLNIPHIV
jgi:putative tricarboxylic transport membrane protein